MATHQVFNVPQQAIGRVALLALVPKVALFFLSAVEEWARTTWSAWAKHQSTIERLASEVL